MAIFFIHVLLIISAVFIVDPNLILDIVKLFYLDMTGKAAGFTRLKNSTLRTGIADHGFVDQFLEPS